MALGAVPDGIMKHSEAANVHGNMSSSGSQPAATALAARIGIMMVVIAVLVVISVAKLINRATVAMATMSGERPTQPRSDPTQSARPEERMASANAKPPPSRRITPQGSLTADRRLGPAPAEGVVRPERKDRP